MMVILLLVIWIIAWISLYKWSIKHKWKSLKENLIAQKVNYTTIATLTNDDKERTEAMQKIAKCDKAIKNLEKKWY